MAKTKTKTKTKTAPYVEGVGRRKTSIARVRLVPGKGKITFLGAGEKDDKEQTLEEYFDIPRLRDIATAPFDQLKLEKKFDVTVKVAGGGIHAQAEAVRLGISRALVRIDSDLKKRLRGLGFLTRDPRMVERKKYGLKKARRAPQWSKR